MILEGRYLKEVRSGIETQLPLEIRRPEGTRFQLLPRKYVNKIEERFLSVKVFCECAAQVCSEYPTLFNK